jgi:AbrB family looped-hinge helix DNA binding protein
MKEHLTVVTRKGQITLPVAIRRRLNIKEGDKVAFVEDEDTIRLIRSDSVVARTAGMLKDHEASATPEQERNATEQAIAEDAVRRMSA